MKRYFLLYLNMAQRKIGGAPTQDQGHASDQAEMGTDSHCAGTDSPKWQGALSLSLVIDHHVWLEIKVSSTMGYCSYNDACGKRHLYG